MAAGTIRAAALGGGRNGLVTYCVYSAPDEDYVRAHAAAAGLPCDRVLEIDTVGPDDFD